MLFYLPVSYLSFIETEKKKFEYLYFAKTILRLDQNGAWSECSRRGHILLLPMHCGVISAKRGRWDGESGGGVEEREIDSLSVVSPLSRATTPIPPP